MFTFVAIFAFMLIPVWIILITMVFGALYDLVKRESNPTAAQVATRTRSASTSNAAA